MGSLPSITLSAVTVEEILYGVTWKARSRIRRWFHRFFEDQCQIMPISEAIAWRSGELRGEFQASGETRSMADMLIAATAKQHQLTLATRNTRHFEGCGVSLFNPFQ